jgi:multidrug efflux pump subunit AcrA (membrane-fusion protein)
VRSARARLAEAQARFDNAATNAARLRPLLAANAVARQEVDNSESQVVQARAAVEEARGALDAAREGLSDTVVRVEIGGRVGRGLLDIGTRVAGVGDVLTTISAPATPPSGAAPADLLKSLLGPAKRNQQLAPRSHGRRGRRAVAADDPPLERRGRPWGSVPPSVL